MLLVVDLVEASGWVVGAERLDLRLVEAALVLSGWLALRLTGVGHQLVWEHL